MTSIEGGSYFLKDVETLVPRIFLDEDLPASERDQLLFAESLVLRVALAIDLFGLPTAIAYRRALLSLKEINARSICKGWKALYECLTSEEVLQTGEWQTFKQFARTYPKWMVAPLIRHLGECEKEHDFMRALQWTKFDSKLSFRDTPSDIEKCEYLDDEFCMQWYDQNDDHSLLDSLNHILREWVVDFPPESTPFMGCHSSGVVQGLSRNTSSPIQKFHSFKMDENCKRYLQFRTSWDVNPLQIIVAEDDKLVLRPMDIPQGITPLNVLFVPKTPLTRRVVCPEESLHMFLQADAASLITKWLNKFHWCNLADQQTSRDMAVAGSLDGSYATVDASKASDFVRHSQLLVILADTPLWPLYNYSRSEYAKVDDFVLRLRKACPMGSRVCFPMETLVFGLACELAVRKTLGRKSRKGDFRVYGDDTVIRSDCYATLRLIMSLLFFKVNDTKSFSERGALIFREACGVYAVNGRVVTPCQYSRKAVPVSSIHTIHERGIPFAVPENAAQALSCIDFANRMLLSGLVNSRRWYLTALRGKEWVRHIWRLAYSDFREDEKRIQQGKVVLHDTPVPTMLTYDHVDVNFNINTREKKYGGNRTGVMQYDRLLAITRPREVKQGSLAYLHWSSERSKTEVSRRNEREYSPAERLTYCSPGEVVWRVKR